MRLLGGNDVKSFLKDIHNSSQVRSFRWIPEREVLKRAGSAGPLFNATPGNDGGQRVAFVLGEAYQQLASSP
uniref:Uncharacterized protein n=1 Tax=Chromera velia CCMP2878 TaxID=1169474 RepID=A0A0G4F9F7_9ALVE|eukprot:Cvel_199.t1-p1 / transcript=Cvel_199.t1 / gene=Cvel_199 / organism=Chromera_velia_CCMP2878 / gene_product=hypothetical protein / transcript_product=hypothetical protein / location=Cvel_scaffold11:238477-238956(+) / protein_length=71 / sequence_SO=supercontig / SO=protein_coding / is_pseudo=false